MREPLTEDGLKKIGIDVLTRYVGKPYNSETYDHIMADLRIALAPYLPEKTVFIVEFPGIGKFEIEV